MVTKKADQTVTVESIADPPQPPVPTDAVVIPGYECDPPQPPPAAE